MKRVLITGSEGEVGLDLAPQLAKRFNVTGFDIKPGTHESIRSIRGDLCNYPEVAKAAAGIDAIVHMAALLPSDSAPDSFVDINSLFLRIRLLTRRRSSLGKKGLVI